MTGLVNLVLMAVASIVLVVYLIRRRRRITLED
jgi:uncharacterized protein YoxC